MYLTTIWTNLDDFVLYGAVFRSDLLRKWTLMYQI
jgi:hypothetical protein